MLYCVFLPDDSLHTLPHILLFLSSKRQFFLSKKENLYRILFLYHQDDQNPSHSTDIPLHNLHKAHFLSISEHTLLSLPYTSCCDQGIAVYSSNNDYGSPHSDRPYFYTP